MEYVCTTATNKLLKLTKRIRGIAGGSSASKTISVLLLLIDRAQSTKEIISVVSESMPHLRKGAMRDFLDIMKSHNYYKEDRWNKTDSTYQFETGSIIEFFGAENWSKVKGARRDILFVNEANHITYETYNQLEIRTRKIVWLDWNPESEFWFYTEILNKQDCDFITLTYKDNEALEQSIIDSIESRKNNKNWYKIYVLGELGELEGKIFKDWQMINDIPHEARIERRGLDFGYTQDPTVIVDIYSYNNGFILDERLYQKGMHNSQIADFIKNLEEPQTLVIADSAEPKSIDEIKMYGVNIIGSTKGPGSVSKGIDFVQSQRISITKRSLNIIKDYRNYMWKTDREGNIIPNTPDEGFSHGPDAIRYGLEGYQNYDKYDDEDYEPQQNIISRITGY